MSAREYRGAEAIDYANRHLTRSRVNPDTWETEYLDAQGRRWVMDYPDSGLHGGGSPRLRRCDGGPSDSTPTREDE
jgi:hypothetical protein